MKKIVIVLCALVASCAASSALAEETPESLRQRANELNKQKDALQRQINELRSRAQMIEAAPRIADVVTRMEGGNPLPPQSRSEHV